MATILITGGTGLIGQALTTLLVSRGYQVIILTRSGGRQAGPVTYASWDVKTGIFPNEALQGADVVVHLAGANVAKGRWTRRRKDEIVHSRTDSSAFLAEVLRTQPNRVRAVISASAVGYYGQDKGRPFFESDPPAGDFLGTTCRLWEENLYPIDKLGKRTVIFRTGIVLAKEGGALAAFRAPLRAGIGAILGGGKQVISWIHLFDMCRMYLHAIENESLHGIYNAAAPEPATNKKLVLSLAGLLRGRFYIPVHVPAFMLKLALGEMSIEVLKSCTVDCGRIRSTGFQFAYPTLESALRDLTAIR